MGANQSADLLVGQKFEETSFNVKNDTHFVRDVNNDLYGESQLLQYKESLTHPYLMLKSKLIASKSEYEEYIKEPQKRKNQRCAYVLPLLNIYQVKQQDYCSKYYKVYMLFQYCEKTLFDEMIQLNEQQQTFNQADILQMIENVLQGLLYLKEQGTSHDMIKASTIAISNDAPQSNHSATLGKGEFLTNSNSKKASSAHNDFNTYKSTPDNIGVKYLISDSRFMHNGKDSYTQALIGDEQDFYLSPQLFTRLKHRYITAHSGDASNLEEQHSIDVSQVFSLGMVAVEMATLKSVRKIYDFDYFCLNKGRLMNKLELISQIYSPQLAFIISKMLIFNEKDRFTQQQVLNLIHSFQEDPSQFIDINFTPEIILENYQPTNSDNDYQNHPSQHNMKEKDEYEGEDVIKRAHKLSNNPLQETRDLHTFKMPSSQGDVQQLNLITDPGNNIHVISNSTNENRSRSKSPNVYVKEFSTPNKQINDLLTPAKSSSHHVQGLSTALHNPNSLSSQKNNLSQSDTFQRNLGVQQNSQLPVSDYNPQPYPYPYQAESDSQLRFHIDEVNNGLYSNSFNHNNDKQAGSKLSSQVLHSQKPSNISSRIPSQKQLQYEPTDFKLEKDYECFPNQSQYNQINNLNGQRMRPTDPIDRKKYSNSFSQSLLQSSLSNTVKFQGNPQIMQSQKSQNGYPYSHQEVGVRQSNNGMQQSNNTYNKTLSEVMTESNNIHFSKKLPTNGNKQYQNNIDFKKRSQTPDFSLTHANFDEINKNIKISQIPNTPNVTISPMNNNNQKMQYYDPHQQLSNKSNRSESLILHSQTIQDSQNNHKYSLKFSPKNSIGKSQDSPKFFKGSQVKRAHPTSKSMHITNPTFQGIDQNGGFNKDLIQSDQNTRVRQYSNYLHPQSNNINTLQVPTQNNNSNFNINNNNNNNNSCYNNSHYNSILRNDDSISVQVPNEVDVNNLEYPAQSIYNFDVKRFQEQKEKLLFSPQKSQLLQNSAIQPDNSNFINNQPKINQSYGDYSQKSIIPQQSTQFNQMNQQQKIGDSYQANYIQSIGLSKQFHNDDQVPVQSYKQQSNTNFENPNYIPSASSLNIAHNLLNGSQKIDASQKIDGSSKLNGSNKIEQSNSVKEQFFLQPPQQNIYQLISQNQDGNHHNYSKSQPINIKSIVKDKTSDNILDNSLINQNLTINGPPTPRNSIRGNRNMYHLYEKSPTKDDLQYKLHKVSIPEEEYQKDLQQTITELEKRIRDFDSRISKSKLGSSQLGSQQFHNKIEEEKEKEKESSFKKFLNSFSCKGNNNVIPDEDKRPIVQQRTPLKHLFTDDRVSPERFPIENDPHFNASRTQYSRPQQYQQSSSQNNTFNSSYKNQAQRYQQSSKSPVQNSRNMKAFFQAPSQFNETQN